MGVSEIECAVAIAWTAASNRAVIHLLHLEITDKWRAVWWLNSG